MARRKDISVGESPARGGAIGIVAELDFVRRKYLSWRARPTGTVLAVLILTLNRPVVSDWLSGQTPACYYALRGLVGQRAGMTCMLMIWNE